MEEAVHTDGLSAKQALMRFDSEFWTRRAPRWLDIVGDYAGQELFFLDGDALLQLVLDDPLLALGKESDVSFQLLHATWRLERILHDIISRDCTFEVIFFETNTYATILTGKPLHVTSSRRLAREIFRRHMCSLSVPVHTFESLKDEKWFSYYDRKRPMFFMGHDGGQPSAKGDLSTERVLCQRFFILSIMGIGIPVVLLHTAEFRDGKILSYVYERSRSHQEVEVQEPVVGAFKCSMEHLKRATARHLNPTDSSPTANTTQAIILHALSNIIAEGSMSSDGIQGSMLGLYLCHANILPTLPFKYRAQRMPLISHELNAYLKDIFLPSVYASLCRSIASLPDDHQGLPDFDLDGRIFCILLSSILSSNLSLGNIVGNELLAMTTSQAMEIGISTINIDTLRDRFSNQPTEVKDNPREEIRSTLLPFSNAVFDRYMGSIHVDVSDICASVPMSNRLESNTVFKDGVHWHSRDPLLPVYLGGIASPSMSEWERKRRERKEQRQMASMQRSAASLTGALGGILRQQVIPAVGKRLAAIKKDRPAHRVSANRKTVAKVLTSKEKLLLENAVKREAENATQNEKWWAERLSELNPLSLKDQRDVLEGFLNNKRASDRWLRPEMLLKQMDTELRMWIADDAREVADIGDRYRVFLATTCRGMLEASVKGDIVLNEKQRKAVLAILEALGLSCLVPGDDASSYSRDSDFASSSKPKKQTSKKGKSVEPAKPEPKPPKLSFTFTTLTRGGQRLYDFMKIKEDVFEYQLRVMGEWMARSLDSHPDPRVDFEPDRWQREVLDKIDADESMLIVAPTSSGKTFISFAAMEKVLRESDDGIVVYVAPTKALVNQVAAEVYARFRKSVPGVNMWAIHTRDYRINNPQNCQILVTVPHILSIMLLSPGLASVWTPRLRRVIVDEVHSISEVEGGAIWEQVLLINPAPLIGLSATVGDPSRFSSWLESVEHHNGRKYSLVLHQHRFNALRKFMYLPQEVRPVAGPLPTHGRDPFALVQVHPIAALALGDPNLPDDLALEPRDCLSLWQAMRQTGEPLPPFLMPSAFFASTPSIAIKDVIRYELELKNMLMGWSKRSDYRDPKSPYQKVIRCLEQPLAVAASGSGVQGYICDDENEMHDHHPHICCMLSVLAELNARDALPCIVFNFNRDHCEKIAHSIVKGLQQAEEQWRATSPIWAKRLAKWKEKQLLLQTKQKYNAHLSRKQQVDDARDGDTSGLDPFDPNAPSEQFTFMGKGTSQHELDKEIDEISWAGSKIPRWAVIALRRGIAVHHAGMNRTYRTLVETLFRKGVLRVIISTGTLALGINAPARTCVLAGDTVYLTALNFRQCAGRAGRRGFDNLGNVVFVGITLDRVQRLLLSRLPKLGGSFPMTTTLVLRLHNLLHGSNSSPFSVRTIESLLTLPQLTVGNESRQVELLHFIRFSIDYLRRLGLLDSSGRPMNLYSVVAHLYPYEPANFALVALFRSGVLHRITQDLDKSAVARDQALSTLMIVLATLLASHTRRSQSEGSLRERIRNSSSCIVMPALPGEVMRTLQEHHASVSEVFACYVKEYGKQHARSLGADNILPLSKRTVGRAFAPEPQNLSPASMLAQLLESNRFDVCARSSFVALSGHGDTFSSVDELVTTSRADVVLPHHAIPSLSKLTDTNHQLDAYAYDFWKHGSLEVLVRDNGIRRGDVWFMLQDFYLALAAIKTSLESLFIQMNQGEGEVLEPDDSDGDEEEEKDQALYEGIQRPPNVDDADWRLYRAITLLKQEFGEKFRKIFA